ncbi:helix-turn-helix domain-containing protein [Falsigemmobacter faecalis]|nr:GAF domain-containing protein [Falsigemmobacter faecalis]
MSLSGASLHFDDPACRLLELLHHSDDPGALFEVQQEIADLPDHHPGRAALTRAAQSALAVWQRGQQSQQRERTAQAVSDIARALTELKSLEEVLYDIVCRGRQLLGSDLSWLSGEQDGSLRVLAIDGATSEATGHMTAAASVGIAGHVVRTAAAFTTRDYVNDPVITHTPENDGTLLREGLRAAVAVPLMAGSRVIGVLTVGDRSERAFTPREVSVLATLASCASVAVRNATAYNALSEKLHQAETRLRDLQARAAEADFAASALHQMISDMAGTSSPARSLALIARLLEGRVILSDSLGRPLLSPPGDTPAPRRLSAALLRAVDAARATGRVQVLTGTGGVHHVAALAGRGGVGGCLVLTRETPLSPALLAFFERAAELMSALLRPEAEARDAGNRDAARLIHRLLEGSRREPGPLNEQLQSYDLTLNSPLHLGLIEAEQGQLTALARSLRERLGPRPGLIGEWHDYLVLLAQPDDIRDLRRRLGEQLYGNLRLSGQAALSAPVQGLAALRQAVSSLKVCLDLSRRLGLERQLSYEPELSLYTILFQGHDSTRIDQVLEALIGPLLRHDAARRGSLCETVLSFLDNSRNASLTARQLGVHVNTVHNRIETALTLMGAADTPGPLVEQHIALRLHQLRRRQA